MLKISVLCFFTYLVLIVLVQARETAREVTLINQHSSECEIRAGFGGGDFSACTTQSVSRFKTNTGNGLLSPSKDGKAYVRTVVPSPSLMGQDIRPQKSIAININFVFDSFELDAMAQTTLDKVVNVLNHTETFGGQQFEIEGHTDSKGSETYNMRLSEKRAKAVYRYLKARGIASHRLFTVAKGESQLLDSSNPESGINRRVEFVRR